MDSTNWTATTTTSWIWFDEAHTLKSIEGTGEDNIVIYIDPATSPDDVAEGKIKIITPNGVIEKTVVRCVPIVIGEEKSLTFKVNGSDTGDDVVVGPCSNGTGNSYQLGVSISHIVLHVKQRWSQGGVLIDKILPDINLTLSDVDVYYIIDGMQSTVLPMNSGAKRPVTIKVVYKKDTSVSNEMTILQDGIILPDGSYDMDKFIETGYSSQDYRYMDFDITDECKNLTSPTCEEGTQDFYCRGVRYTVYGGITGITECKDTINLGGGTTDNPVAITNSDVIYSVYPSEAGYFDSNVLHYYTNTDRTNDKELTISAYLQQANQTATTKFYVKIGTDCGNPFYVHITTNATSIPFSGETIELRYFLSYNESDSEVNVITDNDILKCISFVCPGGVDCGKQLEPENGVFRRNVIVNQNPSQNNGRYLEFTATCEVSENKIATVRLYQANAFENIIPNCDYFVFRYNWSDADGKDLDSLTVITNLPNLTANDGKNVSELTVGYKGTANYLESVGDVKAVWKDANHPYLVHGGDNRESGAEGAIICLRNILESGQVSITDVINIDIYACWYEEKILPNGGNMSIDFYQYTGLTESHNFSDEIRKNGFIFEPVQDNCKLITSDQTNPIQVVAYGTYNWRLALNVEDCLIGGAAYDHVMRLTYNVAEKRTAIEYPATKGLVTKQIEQYAVYDEHISGNKITRRLTYEIDVDSNGRSFEYVNFYTFLYDRDKQKQVENGTNYLFVGGDEYIRIRVYDTDMNNAEATLMYYINDLGQTPRTISYNNGDSIAFVITQNTDKTINFSFTVPQHEGSKRKLDIEFTYNASGMSDCGKALGMFGNFTIYQNRVTE